MQEVPLAYWIENTLYADVNALERLMQLLGDASFLLILICAELFALLGALLWLIFVLRGK